MGKKQNDNKEQRPQTNTALLSLIDASPDWRECSAEEAAEWARRIQDEIERMRDGVK